MASFHSFSAAPLGKLNCSWTGMSAPFLAGITTNFSDRATKSLAGREETLSDRVTVRLRSRLYEMCRDVPIEGEGEGATEVEVDRQRVTTRCPGAARIIARRDCRRRLRRAYH